MALRPILEILLYVYRMCQSLYLKLMLAVDHASGELLLCWPDKCWLSLLLYTAWWLPLELVVKEQGTVVCYESIAKISCLQCSVAPCRQRLPEWVAH